MLAGFERPSERRILIDGEDMAGVPPNRRPVNMVFQSYAVFPHMTVAENVAYGLRVTGAPRAEIGPRSRMRSPWSAFTAWRRASPSSSPAASASASRWPAP